MNITKKKLGQELSTRLKISQNDAYDLINSFFITIKGNLNKKIKIANFGTFTIKKTKIRIGRNPKTLEEFNISSRKKIFFSSSKKVKKELN